MAKVPPIWLEIDRLLQNSHCSEVLAVVDMFSGPVFVVVKSV